jgi:predicted nuclease of predicted toxin-antitoxin system
MAERVRFHLDEHMDPDIALALRRHGIDVTTTVEGGLRTREDERQLEYVRTEGRVVVTDDTDFLRVAAATSDHSGVVFCRRTRHTLGDIIRFLLLVHEAYAAEEMVGRVEYL